MNLDRNAALALALIALSLLSGCSSMIAKSSRYSEVLSAGTPKAMVVEKLGQPKTATSLESGDDQTPCTRHSFVVKGKMPAVHLADFYLGLDIQTFGVAEILLFPFELMRSGLDSLTEKEVFLHFCKRNGVDVLLAPPS